MKRILSFILALAILLGMMPMTARASENTEKGLGINELDGKTISILGDSISTFSGVSNNTSYNSTIGSNAVYYSEGTLGVYRGDTWWQQIIDALGMELLVNNSWSGSTVFYPRKGESSVGYGDRCVNLHNDTTGEEPDVIIVFLGTNDFSYYQSTLGTADIDYDSLITADGYVMPTSTCEAYAIMLHKMIARYPDAEIYCLGMAARRNPDKEDSYADVGQPTAFNAELKTIVERFGATYVDLENCGIDADAEVFDRYMGDGRVHPNAAGMDMITEAVVSVLLGEQTELCSVSYSLNGVESNNTTAAAIEGLGYTASLTPLAGYSNMQITVTMGGVDVTETAYANGTVSIKTVTGDIVITAQAERAPLCFRWEYENGELVSEVNALTKLAGTTSNEVFTNTRYQLQITVLLKHNWAWVLEWKGSGAGGFMLSEASDAASAPFFFRRAGNYLNAFGDHDGSQYNNYGLALSTTDIDGSALHVYRLENHVAVDGTNMVYLYVDGVEIGALNNHYVGGNAQGTTSDWISGKDFKINYIGTTSHPLTNYALEYISVTECVHTYENGICTVCGAEHPNLANYEGKVISILGDSISTFAGYIPTADGFNLEHYARYPQDNLFTEVEHTWWMQVLTALDAKLGINESWRSTEVYNYIDAEVNSSYDGTKACMASVTRIQNLGSNGTPDVILFFGGTNDITQSRPVGTFNPSAAPLEVDLTSVKWDTVADAYVDAIMRMQYYYPDAQIIAMLPFDRNSQGTDKVEQYNSLFISICEHYGVPYVDLRECGISNADLPDGTHPNATGMDYITEAVLDTLLNDMEMEAGEHIVHSVTHNLNGAESSLGYYKGITHGKSFVTTITGENVTVSVTMGGVDITDTAYANSVVTIAAVTGDLVITAQGRVKPIYEDHLQQLPENLCCSTNLWSSLVSENTYYTGSAWGNVSGNSVYSITIPVAAGDQIWATSFQKSGTNGGSRNGIRLTWFDENGVLKSVSPDNVYTEFSANGYVTAPEGAVAVNVVMWNGNESNEVYILNRDHIYENGTCTVCGEAEPVEAFTSTDELVLALRREMVQRNTLIQLRLNGTALSASEVSALILQAYAHTGVPYEGDYIRANMVGYSWSVTTGSDAEGVYSIVTLECNFISDAQMEAEVDAAVDALLAELDLWDATNYEKVKGVYDWITENVQYDFPWDDLEEDTTYYKHTTHAALIAKNAVCQGYASLYYRLMLELGVDCRYISGISTDITGTENHAWNIVYLDGYYYNVDATWDRDLMGHYRYFLCTEANFTGHTRNAEYNTPQFHAQYPMAIAPYVLNIAASGTINGNIAWVLDGDTGTLTVAGTGAIPSYRFSHAPWYDYRESVRKIVVSEGITEVGERAFYWCTNCTEVILPDSLVAIREYGFNNLRNLKTITLPPNLRVIEFCAFSECVALTSITLPNSVTTVGSNAFSNCYALTSAVLSSGMTTVPSSMFGGDYMLKSVVLPEGITYIDDTAFIDCGFTSFTLPATVTGLGTAVFSNCTSLTQFIVEAGNPTYKAVDGVLFSADGTHLICYPAAKSNYSYSVPEGTRYIDYGAFRGQKYMTFVYFPSTLIEIGGYSFSYCKKLYSVTFVSNIDTIGSDAFRSCTSLYSVTFNNPDVYLVGYTFANCTALRNISLPTNLREIPNGLFYGCTYLASITIPSTATKIGSSAFLDCDNLVSITVPGNVKSIGQQAFDFCNKLETIVFEEGVTTLGWICIRNAPKLKKVVIPSSVTRIEQPSNTTSFLFDDCPNVVLHVSCGSYGYSYAVSRGLSYQLSHTVTATVVHPTCTTQGYTRYHCACGSIDYNTDYVSAWGHDYDANIVPPTCHEEGYTCYTCVNCGDTYYDDFVPAAHSYGAWYVIKDATCKEDGEKRRDCANCDHYETDVIEATGHSFGQWYVAKDATCTENGQKRRDCANCAHFETEVIAAIGHNYTSKVTAPTCTEQGYTTHTCANCGDSYVDSYVNAKGHSYGAWYVVKEATCTEDGQKRRDCQNCAHFETEVIAAIGHNYTSKVTAPTCTEQGYTTHTCANCGDCYVDSYVDALGHNHVVTDSRNATCTEDGYITYTCHCGDTYTDVIGATGHSYVDGACEHCGEKDPDAVVTLMGDVNGDGKVNYLDAMLIAQYYVGDITAEDLDATVADVNGDGKINYLDAMLVAQYYVGDIDSFPAEG